MTLPFNQQLFEMAAARFGIAAAQLRNIDGDAKKAIFRFFVRAFRSGDANSFIKDSLSWLEERDAKKDAATAEPPSYKASSRPLGKDKAT